MKEKTIKWIAAWLAGLLLAGFCCLPALAVPEDGEDDDPPTSVQTTSEVSTSRPSSTTTTSEETSTSSYHQTTSQNHTTSNTTTTSRQTTTTSRETATSRSSATSSAARIGGISDGSVDASWGTGYTESSGSTTTTSAASPGRKNIANYFEVMQRLIWLPILLIILSVATLIFVNVRAHRRNLSRKRRRYDDGTDIRSDSRRRR